MSHITRQTAIELAAQHGINAEESQLFGAGDLELLCNAAIQHYIDSAALAQPEPHSDDIAVDAMAAAMKEKLRLARKKGRAGWETCSQQDLSRMLREHVDKGDPRDVANFCAFLYALGFGIEKTELVSDPCPGCAKGGVCRTPTCGRLTLPVDHPFRAAAKGGAL